MICQDYIYTSLFPTRAVNKKAQLVFIINQRVLRTATSMLKKGFFNKLKKLGQKKNIVYIWEDLSSRYMSYIYGL